MKKIKIYAILALVAGAIACKKTPPQSENLKSDTTALNYEAIINAKTINDKTMLDFVDFPTDPEMTKMNKGLYLYMEGMAEVFKLAPQQLSYVLNKLKTTGKNTIVVTNYLTHFGVCKQRFNTKLTELCPEKPIGNDHANSIAMELMNFNGQTQYTPVMLLGNNCAQISNLDLNNGFRFALGTDAEESSNNGNGNGKLIPSWNFKKNGQIKLELVSEQQVRNSNIPVFIFTPGYVANGIKPSTPSPGFQPDYADVNDGDGGVFIINGGCATFNTGNGNNGGNGGSGNSGGGNPSTSPAYQKVVLPPCTANCISPKITLDGVNCNYHYEAYGASELRISSRYTTLNSGVMNMLSTHDGWFLDKIPSNYIDCNCYYPMNRAFADNVADLMGINFVTYEHDWYATIKNLYYVEALSGDTPIVPLQVQATLATETYQMQFFVVQDQFPVTPFSDTKFTALTYGLNVQGMTRQP